MKAHKLNQSQALSFIFGGHAIFTLKNTDTGNRYTYKIAKPKHTTERDNVPLFVRVLTGPDNNQHYTFIGTIWENQRYAHSRKSKVSQDAPSVKGIAWLLQRLLTQSLPSNFEFWHEGRCARCGRKLTVPESIEQGYGPECINFRLSYK